MRKLLWMAVTLAFVASGVVVFVRGNGISARRPPTALETAIAKRAWRFLIPDEFRRATNPVPPSPAVIRAALEHWADHCASCHGNNGSGDVALGRSMHPPAPDMRSERTQQLTDGELFYAIEQGIPFTGMPAWSTATESGERSSWQLVHFIRYLSKLTEEEIREMEALNPKSPVQDRKRREIDEFLSGKPKVGK